MRCLPLMTACTLATLVAAGACGPAVRGSAQADPPRAAVVRPAAVATGVAPRPKRITVADLPAVVRAACRVPRVIATVNGEPITDTRWLIDVWRVGQGTARITADRVVGLADKFLTRLIQQRLLRQETRRHGVKATRAEVDAALAEYAGRFGTESGFRSYLQAGHSTVADLRRTLSLRLAVRKLLLQQGAFVPKATRTGEDPQWPTGFYEAQNRLIERLTREAHVNRHIVCSGPAPLPSGK